MTYEGSSGARYWRCRASRGNNYIVFTFEPISQKRSTSVFEAMSLAGPSAPGERENDEVKYFMIVQAILTSQNYPTRKIKKPVYKLIQDEVEKLKRASQKHLLVKVHNLDQFSSSCVKVDCIGLSVANFFNPLNGIKLKDVKLRVIPKKLSTERLRVTIELKFASGLTVVAVFHRLELCYPNLNTNEWYVINSCIDDETLKITVLMDKPSADFIREREYVLEWVHPEIDHSYTDMSESD